MWRSRTSGLNRSSRRICSSDRVSRRFAVVFSRRSRRSCLVSRPWRCQTPHPAGGDLDALQHQLLGNPHRPVAGMFQGVVEDGLLDLGRYPVGMLASGAGQTVDQAVGAVGLEVATDLVELLPAVDHHLTGFGDIAEVGGQLQQRQLASCYLLLRGHVALRSGRINVQRHHPDPASKRHVAAMCQVSTVSAHTEGRATPVPRGWPSPPLVGRGPKLLALDRHRVSFRHQPRPLDCSHWVGSAGLCLCSRR